MADIILKKTDFLKNLSKKQKVSSGEEGSMAAVIDAAKLRQVVSWMNNVEELINSKLSSYLPLSGGNIDPGPLEYRGKSVFTNDSYIVDSRLSSNIARISDLNSKINEIRLFIKQISSDIEENTDDKIVRAITVLSGTVDSKLTAAIQDLENEMSDLSGVLTGDIFDLSCELKDEIATKLAGVYRYKGTVTYVEELADLETAPIVGDCWNILSGYRPDHTPSESDIKVNPGDNAVWNGDAWDILAGIVDVSNFVEKEEVRQLEERIGNSISEFAGNLDRKITTENERAVGVETILSSALDDLSGTREKTAILSQFATRLYVDETFATKQEVQEAIDKVHTHANLAVLSGITAEQVAVWDASEQNAKDYADEQIAALSDVYDGKGSADTAEQNAKAYTDEQIAALSDVYDGKGAADTAEQNAKTYADEQIAALSDVYDTKGAAATAEQNAKNYANEQVNAVRDSLSNYISKEDAYNAIAPEISAYNNFLSATPDSIAEIIEWNRGLHTALSNLAGLFDSSSEIKDTMELPLEANKSYLITNTGIGSISIYAEPADVTDGTITISAYDIA